MHLSSFNLLAFFLYELYEFPSTGLDKYSASNFFSNILYILFHHTLRIPIKSLLGLPVHKYLHRKETLKGKKSYPLEASALKAVEKSRKLEPYNLLSLGLLKAPEKETETQESLKSWT